MGIFSRFRKKRGDAEPPDGRAERDAPDDDAPAADASGDDASGGPDGAAPSSRATTGMRCAALASIPVGFDRELLFCRDDGAMQLMSASDAGVIRRCTTFAPLDEHVDRIADELQMDDDQAASIRELLEDVAGELFVDAAAVRDRLVATAVDGDAAVIEDLCITTCDRPAALTRGLPTFVANCRAHGREPRVTVFDASRSAATRDANRAALREIAAADGVAIHYAGERDRERYVDRICAEANGDDDLREAARSALFDVHELGNTFGINRNAMLLDRAGTVFLAVDDDVMCRIAAAPAAGPGVELATAEPTEFRFFASHADAVAAAPALDRDLLGLHERVTGRAVGSIVADACADGGALRLDRLAADALARLRTHGGAVRATMTGFYGDNGASQSTYYLRLRGGSRRALLADYAAFRTSKVVHRAPSQLTVNGAAFFMAVCSSYDDRSLLPPFPAVFRSEDGVFAHAVRVTDPDGYLAQLPWMVEHKPVDTREYSEAELFRLVTGLRSAHQLQLCVASFGPVPAASPTARLRRFGTHLAELGRLSPANYLEMIRLLGWRDQSARREALEAALHRYDGAPAAWADDVERCISLGADALAAEDYTTPADLVHAGLPPDRAVALTQRTVGDYGALVERWPEIDGAARRLAAGGMRMAVAIDEAAE